MHLCIQIRNKVLGAKIEEQLNTHYIGELLCIKNNVIFYYQPFTFTSLEATNITFYSIHFISRAAPIV